MSHKGKYSSPEVSETSNNFSEEDVEELEDDDNNEEENGTKFRDFDSDGDGNKDTKSVRGPAERIHLLSPRARTEALGAMERAKASS